MITYLNNHNKALNGTHVLILGVSYKKDIDDMRESPTLKLIEILISKGVEVNYSDPYVPKLNPSRHFNFDMSSVEITKESLSKYDIILLSTDHTSFDYKFIAENGKLIVDTRNSFEKNGIKKNNIFKA